MAGTRKEWLQFGSGKTYFHRVHRPLQCLVFITPLLLFYQIASFVTPIELGGGVGGSGHVIAFILMRNFFALFGAFGTFLPLLAVIAILFFWHLARRDPWELDPRLYAGMAAEAIIWGVPCFVIGVAIQRHLPTPAAGVEAVRGLVELSWQNQVILSVGAGVYEELLFRLIGINILSMIFVDAFEIRPSVSIPLIIVLSSVLFSLYHYLGHESFALDTFSYRTAFGIYLAGVYVYRGFGITVGAHTVYDLIYTLFAMG